VLEKRKILDKIEVLEDGTIQAREVTRVLEDGEILSQSFTNRIVIEPGDNTTTMDQRIKDVSGVIHTDAIVGAFQAKKAAREAKKKGLKQERPKGKSKE
jgi:hypothetical protein